MTNLGKEFQRIRELLEGEEWPSDIPKDWLRLTGKKSYDVREFLKKEGCKIKKVGSEWRWYAPPAVAPYCGAAAEIGSDNPADIEAFLGEELARKKAEDERKEAARREREEGEARLKIEFRDLGFPEETHEKLLNVVRKCTVTLQEFIGFAPEASLKISDQVKFQDEEMQKAFIEACRRCGFVVKE